MISAIIITVFIFIDQLLKHLATVYLAPVGKITVIPKIVQLRYVLNDGAAFGLFGGSQFMLQVVTSIGLIVLLYMIYGKKTYSKIETFSLIMVFSGGAGNLINRVASGYVVDYIDPVFVNFAVFNFADCLICVGLFLLTICVFSQEIKEKKQKEMHDG